MHFGIEIVPFGDFADPRQIVKIARAAERAGWEGICLWDHLVFPYGAGDPWVMFAAVAAVTQHLRLIPGVANLPRYRPQNLARLLTGIDLLSQGRMVLGAGLGAMADDFVPFGDTSDARTRAEMLDEGLEVITRLWSGEPLQFQGKYYQVNGAALIPQPIQQSGAGRPCLPVWIGGESRPALRRAARWDGWIMGTINENCETTFTPEQVAADVAYIQQHRSQEGSFEVAVSGVSQPGQNDWPRQYAQAGATWWLESIFLMRGSLEYLLDRIKAGPPA